MRSFFSYSVFSFLIIIRTNQQTCFVIVKLFFVEGSLKETELKLWKV